VLARDGSALHRRRCTRRRKRGSLRRGGKALTRKCLNRRGHAFHRPATCPAICPTEFGRRYGEHVPGYSPMSGRRVTPDEVPCAAAKVKEAPCKCPRQPVREWESRNEAEDRWVGGAGIAECGGSMPPVPPGRWRGQGSAGEVEEMPNRLVHRQWPAPCLSQRATRQPESRQSRWRGWWARMQP